MWRRGHPTSGSTRGSRGEGGPVRRALRTGTLALAVAVMGVAACGPNAALWAPTPEMLAVPAPDSFLVEVETSEGTFDMTMHRAWSPLGVDRMHHLMRNDFYAGARFYRVASGFVAQWGFSGDPALDSLWEGLPIADEPVVESNLQGVVSFARGGAESRSYTLFLNLVDNQRLDEAAAGGVVGYPPIGRVVRGLDVIDGFYPGYTDDPPDQDSITQQGNEYLRRRYPQLDSIVTTRIIYEWR
ncbi:MAG: peptidylprolyl isomerase [Gemmatimonadetes bacterium]|nr:peptidylprolyl isomerase [Gemmatimonadota bacterium]